MKEIGISGWHFIISIKFLNKIFYINIILLVLLKKKKEFILYLLNYYCHWKKYMILRFVKIKKSYIFVLIILIKISHKIPFIIYTH